MSVYTDMDKYEAAEVQIKKMDRATVEVLERAAVRDQECDFCGSVPKEPCRFSTWKSGMGSPIKGAHIARQFAALRTGWNLEDEELTYGGPFISPSDMGALSPPAVKALTTLIEELNVDDLIGAIDIKKVIASTPQKLRDDLSDLIG